MRTIEGEQVLMRIFVGESDQWERRPLHSALLELFRAKGLAGATALKGVAGFGPRSVLHTAGILKLSADLPMIIEVVDSQEHLDAVLPEVDRMMSGGLITIEKVRVLRYAP
jgi:PII-like signaling protein